MHQHARTRRIAVALASTAVAALALSSCAGADVGSGDIDEVDSINVTFTTTPWSIGVLEHLDEFEAEHGVTVNAEELALDQLSDQYQVKLNARSSEIDVMMVRAPQDLRLFHENGWLAPLTEQVVADAEWDWEDFQPSTRDAVTIDETVLGVPVFTERHVMYVNDELLSAAGVAVPTTLDELREAAAEIHDPENGVFGVTTRGKVGDAVTSFSSFLYSFGGDFTIDGESGIGSDEAVEAYTFYGDLLREYGPPGVTNMGGGEASAIFAQGKAGFYLDQDGIANNITDPTKSAVHDRFSFAAFPAGPAGARPYNTTPMMAAVNAYSEKQGAAWEFIKWATSAEMLATIMADNINPSPRQSSWEDASAVAAFPEQLVEIVTAYTEIGVDHDRPQVIDVGRAREIVSGPLTVAIEGGDVRAAAEASDAEFQAFLDRDR